MPKNKMGFSLKASIVTLALLSSSLSVFAAGAGKLTVLSALGQSLRAEIDLSASKDELSSLTARLGTPDQFRQQGVEYSPALGGVILSVEKRSNGEPYIRMTTDRPVNDPYLDVLIEINWSSGRMLREYTFLLDPPEMLARAPVSLAVPETRSSSSSTVSSPMKTSSSSVGAVADSSVSGQKSTKKAKAEKPVKVDDAPAKSADAAPAKTPSSTDASREVQRGDTLGKIAADYVQDGVNLDQMLVAIYSNNQDAFIADDMNRLKVGKILAIPGKEAVASVTQAEARKTVAMHSANFNAYRKKLAESAASAPAAVAATDKVSAGKIAPKVEDKALVQKPGGDSVVISKTELGKADKSSKGAVEDKIARERALQEEKNRVAALEANVAKLQKLDAEKKAAADKAAADKASADKAAADKAIADKAVVDKAIADKAAADEKAAVDKAIADKAAADAAAATAQAEAPKADAPGLAVPADVKPPEPVPAPAPVPAPQVKAPEPEAPPSFFQENKPLVLGGVLILALVGLFVYRSKKNNAIEPLEQPSQFGEPSALSSVFGGVGGQSIDTRDASIGDNFSQASITGGDGSAGVDPVAEAEVYMAYGREAQAEEILLEAMKSEPTRHAIHLKLLELYAARKSVRPFEEVAKDLYRQTGGSGAVWQKASAMGQVIDPGNSLYLGGGLSASNAAVDDFGTNTVIMQPGQLARMAAEQSKVVTQQFDQPLTQAQSAATMVMSAPVITAPPELDFDLDLGSIESGSKNAPEVLDFDLDLGTGSSNAASASGAAPALDIEFDLEVPSIQAPEPLPPPINFDFNMDKPSAAAPAAMDFGSIDLDLKTPPSAFASTASGADIPDAGENPEVATKLELAQAYEEMGDKEGMRELLQEVLTEGSAAQQELARNKLAQHGL